MNSTRPVSGWPAEQLIAHLARARAQLRTLIAALPADGWLGPRASHLNPPLWEFGHLVWFQERWCLRARPDGTVGSSLLGGADLLYDSSAVPHDTRWDLPLLEPAAVDDYAAQVSAAIDARLRDAFNSDLAYFAELCVYHELMHIEAWWMAFQDLGYAAPAENRLGHALPQRMQPLQIAAGEVVLGSGPDQGFIFDNEKWPHTVPIPAFEIDATPISEIQFAAFVDAGGYQNPTGWTAAGLAWRTAHVATQPRYWRKHGAEWQVRRFADWTALGDTPMLHLNRFEAEACADWMGRQLPSAGQWLQAVQQTGFHWGAGWEWTRNAFEPYPGFSADPYQDYSQPWFHSHSELRGGGPYTNPLLKRPGFRNFYLPHRRDPFAGFRTVGTA